MLGLSVNLSAYQWLKTPLPVRRTRSKLTTDEQIFTDVGVVTFDNLPLFHPDKLEGYRLRERLLWSSGPSRSFHLRRVGGLPTVSLFP